MTLMRIGAGCRCSRTSCLALALFGHHLLKQRVALNGARSFLADSRLACLHGRAGAARLKCGVFGIERLVGVGARKSRSYHAARRRHLRTAFVRKRTTVVHAVHFHALERAVRRAVGVPCGSHLAVFLIGVIEVAAGGAPLAVRMRQPVGGLVGQPQLSQVRRMGGLYIERPVQL